jgi:hypothetical protein
MFNPDNISVVVSMSTPAAFDAAHTRKVIDDTWQVRHEQALHPLVAMDAPDACRQATLFWVSELAMPALVGATTSGGPYWT